MTLPIATSPRSRVLLSMALLCVAFAFAACGTAKETYTPGTLSKEQKARCLAAAQAYVDSDPSYPALRDELKQDPVAIKWFVRYLVFAVIKCREGQVQLVSEETMFLDQVRGSTNEPVRWDLPGQRPDSRAIAQIIAIGEPSVEVVVKDLATSGQEFLRALGIEVLTGIGDPAVPALLELARSGDQRQQRVAARALGQVGARGASLEALRELSHSPEWRIRSDAAQGLARGGSGARDLLFSMLSDEDPFVRRKSAESLGHYEDPVAAGRLIDFMEKCKGDGDMDCEIAAQDALQHMAGTKGPRSVSAWRRFAAELPAVETSAPVKSEAQKREDG